MDDYRQQLLERFRNQETFARDYSPLYAHLFGQVAGWLEADSAGQDPLVQWLVEAGRSRTPFDVALLLLAGVHKDVLGDVPASTDLAHYFPSAGGSRSPDEGLEPALRQAILERREQLAAFIRTANVQTNETARGLCWLLPLQLMPWDEVCLVDLGASAGLNLLANHRAYRLVKEETAETLLDLGQAPPVQFTASCRGELSGLANVSRKPLPKIRGRIGCDLMPFALDTAEAERTLIAYVWADQLSRLDRLKEAIAIYKENQMGDVPIQLHPVNLPDGLAAFLRDAVPQDETPVVIYNTFMVTYLSDKGASFKETIGRWAAGRTQPVLWLQWEPIRDFHAGPAYGWCGWTADLWQGTNHQSHLLAWVHPHGTQIQFEPAFATWPPNR